MLIKYWQGTYELRATNPFPREPLMARLVHPLSKPILIILNPRIMDHYIDVITTAELKVLMEQYAAEAVFRQGRALANHPPSGCKKSNRASSGRSFGRG